MSAQVSSNGKQMILVFLGGAALGTVAGLLFAPRPGKQTREQIKEFAKEARGRLVRAPKDEEDVTHAA